MSEGYCFSARELISIALVAVAHDTKNGRDVDFCAYADEVIGVLAYYGYSVVLRGCSREAAE